MDTRSADEQVEDGERRDGGDRRSQRRRILKGVKLSFGNEFCALEGVMRNVSDTGALIKLKDGFLVPDEVVIHNELDGYKVVAEVVRRASDTIGVRFIGERVAIEAKKHQVVTMMGFNNAAPGEPAPVPHADEAPVPDSPHTMEPGIVPRRSRNGAARPKFGKLGS